MVNEHSADDFSQTTMRKDRGKQDQKRESSDEHHHCSDIGIACFCHVGLYHAEHHTLSNDAIMPVAEGVTQDSTAKK